MRIVWLVALLATLWQPGAGAQQRVGLELRGGLSVPAGGFSDGPGVGARLGAGPTLSVQIQVPRGTRGALQLGFSQHRARCAEEICAGAGDFVSTGWNVGLRRTLRPGPEAPWVRVGLVLDRSEWGFPQEEGFRRRGSYLALGGEVGGGVAIRLAERVALAPGVRYALFNTRFPTSELVRVRLLVADLGLLLAF